jgi:hypothetical protein
VPYASIDRQKHNEYRNTEETIVPEATYDKIKDQIVAKQN